MNDTEKLKQALKAIKYSMYVEVIECMFTLSDDELTWNTDSNQDELENIEGETYGAEIREGVTEIDGHYYINGDNGCGETITYIVDKAFEWRAENDKH